MTPKQTPHEQLDEALRDIWSLALFGMPRETTNSDAVYDAHPDDVVESKRTILAVIKGLPAMQEEDASWQKIWEGGKVHKIDDPETLAKNALRHQILAELGETNA